MIVADRNGKELRTQFYSEICFLVCLFCFCRVVDLFVFWFLSKCGGASEVDFEVARFFRWIRDCCRQERKRVSEEVNL